MKVYQNLKTKFRNYDHHILVFANHEPTVNFTVTHHMDRLVHYTVYQVLYDGSLEGYTPDKVKVIDSNTLEFIFKLPTLVNIVIS